MLLWLIKYIHHFLLMLYCSPKQMLVRFSHDETNYIHQQVNQRNDIQLTRYANYGK